MAKKTKPIHHSKAPASGSSAGAKSSSDRHKPSTRDLLKFYIKSGKAGLYLTTFEETRAEAEMKSVASELRFRLYSWSLTQGLICVSDNPPTLIPDTVDPVEMLDNFQKLPLKSIVLARDLHMLLGDANQPNALLIRKIKDAIKVGTVSNRVLMTVGCRFVSIAELEKEWAVVEFKLPDKESLNMVLTTLAESAGIELDGNRDPILEAGAGLTTQEFSDAVAMSIAECGEIRPEIVSREKANTVKKNGILEIIETDITAADVAGLDIGKGWITKRKLAFTPKARKFGLPTPKGVLFVGIPGSGKSLIGKATASILGVPLLKLDAGKLFGSLVGQSEENLRTVIQTAEAVAPCVLFVDELEKGFSGSKSSGQTDGGTSARVFGTFLNWMNDKTSPVFVFATANDISQLPPEFLRKGRFDELFFVDLPDIDERAAIWQVHISKHGRKPDAYDIKTLSDRTEGYTGAEIEAAVNEGLYAAFGESDGDGELEDRHMLEAVKNTVPLSRTMAPQIDALRTWANGRARRASAVKDAVTQGRKLA